MKPLLFTKHATSRMANRDISLKEVREILMHGEVIKNYPIDKPYPSRLLIGHSKQKPIHVVVSDHPEYHVIITTYIPDEKQWTDDFKRRR